MWRFVTSAFERDSRAHRDVRAATGVHQQRRGGRRLGRCARDVLAAVAAQPVYELLGRKGMGATEFPAVETGLMNGDLAFRQHASGHTDGPNWPTFLTFAERYFHGPASTSRR